MTNRVKANGFPMRPMLIAVIAIIVPGNAHAKTETDDMTITTPANTPANTAENTAENAAPTPPATGTQQVVMDLARRKWVWMAQRDMGALDALFHPAARFVHMGATMDRAAELAVIHSGQIVYQQADISEMSAELIGTDTAIVYTRLRLLAVVGGNSVTNPFSVTEVYARTGGEWQLATMAFTRLLGE
ncbi:MAG: nuclear transport factor 2 family protein [Sphingopyxis sp.]